MDGPMIRIDGQQVIYRASAIGYPCIKALVAARMEFTPVRPPEKMQRVFDAGHNAEEPAIAKYEEMIGRKVFDRQGAVFLPITDRIAIQGHIDGAADSLIEVKSQSQSEWDAFNRDGWNSGFFPRYRWQVSCYMLACNMPLKLLRYNRDTGELAIEHVTHPPISLREIRQRVLQIEAMALRDDLPDECSASVFPCPYPYLHRERDAPEEYADPIIEALAWEYEEARRIEKRGKKRRGEARKALISALEGAPEAETATGIRVTFREVRAGPARLSREAEEGLRAGLLLYHGLDLADYKTPSLQERINVYIPKELRGTSPLDSPVEGSD